MSSCSGVRMATAASARRRLRPPLLAAALVALALLLHATTLLVGAPVGRLPIAGGALAAAGIGWLLWAAWTLRVAATPIGDGEPLVLVEEGPYRFGRNPMVLGAAVALVGAALALGAPALAVAALTLAWLIGRTRVAAEEAHLRQRFGGWYSDYQARVRRWL